MHGIYHFLQNSLSYLPVRVLLGQNWTSRWGLPNGRKALGSGCTSVWKEFPDMMALNL